MKQLEIESPFWQGSPASVLMFNPLDLFPCSVRLELRPIIIDPGAIGFVVETAEPIGCCPNCGTSSAKIHSRYRRALAGLPWNGCRVGLEVLVHRFVCQPPDCPRRIFAEQLPDLAAPYARSTVELHQTHTQIGAVAGGEGGCRLAARLAMPTSPDTLFRRVRQAKAAHPDTLEGLVVFAAFAGRFRESCLSACP